MTAPAAKTSDSVLLTRAVERGYITPAQAQQVAERTIMLEAVGDALVAEGLLTRRMVENLAAEQPTLKPESTTRRDDEEGLATRISNPSSQLAVEPTTVAGFDLIGILGQGGMGTVHRAVQRSLGRQVALKVISGEFAKNKEFAERFLREARAAGAVNHPNVITCFDVGITGNRLYMALELVTGGDASVLAHRAGGRLPERRVIEIAADAARGLVAIARAGLIHRDIKPSNIFITEDGVAKLADLGLARSTAGDDRMTQTGHAMGTPAYMSPEQARGDSDIDIRSDICALGATMYAMVTGKPPFEGTSPWVIVAKVMQDPAPDPRTLEPDLSAGFTAVLARMMAKRREDRYPGPEHLLCDLEHLLAGEDPLLEMATPSTAVIRRKTGTVPTIVAGLTGINQRTPTARSDSATHPTLIGPPPPSRPWLLPVAITLAAGLGAGAVALFMRPTVAVAPAPAIPGQTVATATTTPAAGTNPVAPSGTTAQPRPGDTVPVGTAAPDALAVAARDLQARLGATKATVTVLPGGTLAVDGFNADFRDLALLARTAPISRLSLAGCRRITDLTPLAGLPLTDLDLTGLDALESLAGLERMPLRRLVLDGCKELDGDLMRLSGKKLERLSLRGCASLRKLSGIEGMPLTELDLGGCAGLRGDLLALHGIALEKLSLAGCAELTSLTGLQGLPLRELDLSGVLGLNGDLIALNGLPLAKLSLAGCTRLLRLTGIETLPLVELDLSDCPRLVPDLDTLTKVERADRVQVLRHLPSRLLVRLSLARNPWLTHLRPLQGMRIQKLDLSGCDALKGDLSELSLLPLSEVDASGCTALGGLGGLVPIKLTRLVVTGAGKVARDEELKAFLGRKDLVIVR